MRDTEALRFCLTAAEGDLLIATEVRNRYRQQLIDAIRKEVADEIMTRPCGHEAPTQVMSVSQKVRRSVEARFLHRTAVLCG